MKSLLLICLVPPIFCATVIDVLSQNVEFSVFLRLLQKSGLIPYINELTNFTLIAPVNLAFSLSASLLKLDIERYIIMESFLSSDIHGVVLKNSLKTVSDKVHNPILLENRPFSDSWRFSVDGIEVVEPDLVAYALDLVVHGINALLPEVPTTCDYVTHELGLSTLYATLLQASCNVSGSTVIVPQDAAVPLNPIEMDYLVSEYGTVDRNLLVNRMIVDLYVGGSSADGEYPTRAGSSISIESTNGGRMMIIDGSQAPVSNILTLDGVVHVVSQFSTDGVVFTPRKYLYGLGAADFVEQVDLKKLGYLLDDNTLKQTLFIYEGEDEDEMVTKLSNQIKNIVLYHFVVGSIDTQKSGLYDLKMCGGKKLAGCQKMKILVSNKGIMRLNDDAVVVGKATSIGNTDIFYLSNDISVPGLLAHAVNLLSRCTASMKYMAAFGMLDLKNNKQGYTVFLPCFSSWSRLDLTLDYLRRNESALIEILQNGIVNDVVYSDFENDLVTTNLNGEQVEIHSSGDYNGYNKLTVGSHEIYVEKGSDIIFDQGVVQPIEGVVIPKSVQITLKDLIETASPDGAFLELLEFTNLSYVLEDKNFLVILPSSRAIKAANFTRYTPMPILESFLKLHILPNNMTEENHDDIFDCGARIPTLLESVHLECRPFNEKSKFLKIVEGSNTEVRVLRTGCSTNKNSSCVFVLDNAILPEWLSTGKKLRFHIIAIFGLGVIFGIICVMILVPCCLYFIITKKREEEGVEGEHSRLLEEERTDYGGRSEEPRDQDQREHEQSAPKPILQNTRSSDVFY